MRGFGMRSAKVGVIVPSRNRTQWLAQCIDSIKAQTITPHRILLVDDGSDPPLDHAAAQLGIEYFRTDVGNGLNCSKVRTVGFQQITDCDYILPIDNDDMIEPQYIEKLLKCFDHHMVAIAYPRVVSFGDCKGVRDNTVSVGGLVRYDVLQQLGGFPDTTGWDEMALAQMIRALGFHARFSDAVYWYRRHSDSISGPYRNIRRPWHETINKRADWLTVVHVDPLAVRPKNPGCCFDFSGSMGSPYHKGSMSICWMMSNFQGVMNRLFTQATSDYIAIELQGDEYDEMHYDDFNSLLEILQPDVDVAGLGEFSGAIDFLTTDPPTTTPATWSQDDVGGFSTIHGVILSRNVYMSYRFTSGPDWVKRFFAQIYSDGLNIKARWKPCPKQSGQDGQKIKRINPQDWKIHKATM